MKEQKFEVGDRVRVAPGQNAKWAAHLGMGTITRITDTRVVVAWDGLITRRRGQPHCAKNLVKA